MTIADEYCDHPTIADYIDDHGGWHTANGHFSTKYAYARAHRRGWWATNDHGIRVFRHGMHDDS